MAGNLLISLVINAIDNATSSIRKVTDNFKLMREASKDAEGAFKVSADLRQAAEGASVVAAKLRGLYEQPVQDATEFQTALARLSLRSNTTAQDMGKLRAAAFAMGSTTEFSAKAVAVQMDVLRSAMGVTDTIAQMPAVLTFANANMLELADATRIVIGTLGSYRLGAQETTRITDTISKAAQLSGISAAQFGQGLARLGSTATSVGVELDQVVAVMGMLGKAGVAGETAAGATEAILARLANPRNAKDSAAALEQIGVKAFDKGKLRDLPTVLTEIGKAIEGLPVGSKMRGLTAIFGREGAQSVMTLFSAAGASGIRNFTAELAKAGGESARMSAIMDKTAGDAMETLQGAISTTSTALGEALLPLLTKVREIMAVVIGAIGNWASRHPKLTAAIMLTVGAIAVLATVLTGLLFTVSTVVSAFGSLKIGLAAIKTSKLIISLIPLNAALWTTASAVLAATWPFVLIVAAIATVVGAVYLAIKNWDKLVGIWERFKQASVGTKIALVLLLAPVLALVGPILALAYLGKKVIDNWEPIKTFFVGLWEAVANGVRTAIAWLERVKIPGPLRSLLDASLQAGRTIAGAAGSTAREVGYVLSGDESLAPAPKLANQPIGGTLNVRIDSPGARATVTKSEGTGGLGLQIDTGLAVATP